MRKHGLIILLLCVALVFFSASAAFARAVAKVCFLDVSGSLTAVPDCDVQVLNVRELRKAVDALNIKERILIYAFGWEGAPKLIVDAIMPLKRGGGGKMLGQKKSEVLKTVADFLKKGKRELDDTATDIVGALRYFNAIKSDLQADYDVQLIVFSDGIQTLNLNVRMKNKTGIPEYISSLQRYLQSNQIHGLAGIGIDWYGGGCPMKWMTHTDYANMASMVRSEWVRYMTQNGAGSIEYKVLYQ